MRSSIPNRRQAPDPRRPSASASTSRRPGINFRVKSSNDAHGTGLRRSCADPDRPCQRERNIAYRQTGKTAIALERHAEPEAATPTGDDNIKLYLRLRRDRAEAPTVAQFVNVLEVAGRPGIFDHRSRPPRPIRLPMPNTRAVHRCTMANIFRDNGMHAVHIYDDLSPKQAVAYLNMSAAAAPPAGPRSLSRATFYLHRRCSSVPPSSTTTGLGLATGAAIIRNRQPTTCRPIFPPRGSSITDGRSSSDDLFFQGIRPRQRRSCRCRASDRRRRPRR